MPVLRIPARAPSFRFIAATRANFLLSLSRTFLASVGEPSFTMKIKNALMQFVTAIDGMEIYFLRIVPTVRTQRRAK